LKKNDNLSVNKLQLKNLTEQGWTLYGLAAELVVKEPTNE
jgi:hypothetical protein